MRFISTRDPALSASLSEALKRGLAPDGGLYVPERFPVESATGFEAATELAATIRDLLAAA